MGHFVNQHPTSPTSNISNIQHLEYPSFPTLHILNILHPDHVTSWLRHILTIPNIPHSKHSTSWKIHILNIPHFEHPTSQTFHIRNVPHLKHPTSPTSHITNIPHPEHSTSQTSHIPNISHPKYPTSCIPNIPHSKHSNIECVRCLGYRMLGNVECLGCGIFGMWDVWSVGCETLVYKMLFERLVLLLLSRKLANWIGGRLHQKYLSKQKLENIHIRNIQQLITEIFSISITICIFMNERFLLRIFKSHILYHIRNLRDLDCQFPNYCGLQS